MNICLRCGSDNIATARDLKGTQICMTCKSRWLPSSKTQEPIHNLTDAEAELQEIERFLKPWSEGLGDLKTYQKVEGIILYQAHEMSELRTQLIAARKNSRQI